MAAIVRAVAGERPVTATLGDLPMSPQVLADAALAMAGTGVDMVKAGLYPTADARACARALGATGVPCVGVLFADLGPAFEWIEHLAAAGFVGVMVDTAHKSSGGLRACMPTGRLRRFLETARSAGLMAGLAGSLDLYDIPPLLELGPDLLGFRAALCGSRGRAGPLNAVSVAAVRRAMDRADRVRRVARRATTMQAATGQVMAGAEERR